MPDPFKAKGTMLNPRRSTAGEHVPLNQEGEALARDGYAVLERADRGDPYNPHLRGLAPPVTNDRPDVAWDEEK